MADRFALLLKLHKIQPVGIVPPAIYAEYIGGKVVQGYMKITQNDYAWHVWVEKDGIQIDMNKILYKLYNKGYDDMNIELYNSVPENCNIQKIDSVVAEWNVYNDDPQKFWKNVPKNIKETRTKIFKSLK